MTKARIFTTAGLIHLTVAALLALTFLLGQPAPAVGYSGLGFTPTPTSPTVTETPKPPPPVCKLTITKTASPAEVLPGDLVTFVIQVCNVGNKTCENVIVSDDLPDELELVSASASKGRAVVVGNDVRAEFGDLVPGECAELTIVARVRDDVPPCTHIANVATIGDLVSNRVTVHVVGLLPESGRPVTLTVVAGLVAMGAILTGIGLTLERRNRASGRSR